MASAANVQGWVDLQGGGGVVSVCCVYVCVREREREREREWGRAGVEEWGKGPSLQDQHKWNCIDSVNAELERDVELCLSRVEFTQ